MAFIDILWPKSCHICSKIMKRQLNGFDKYICASCFADMKKNALISCQICGANLDIGNKHTHLSCLSHQQNPPVYQKLISCYLYEGATKKLIHSFKYEHKPYLVKSIMKLINERLAEYMETSFKIIDYLVAIPLHPARLREREFNQSELIAKEISQQLQKPLVPALKKIKHTKSQTTLNKTERFLNLRGAFAINDNICVKNKNILLIDDVATTTATITEAASLLKKFGAQNICVLTFAKGSNNEDTA